MPSPYAVPRNATAPAPLDTRTRIETPEGIDLLLRPAGLVPRALAFGMDFSFRALILGALFLVFSLFESFGAGLTALSLFLVTWWYTVLFEVLNQGRGQQAPGTASGSVSGVAGGGHAEHHRGQARRRVRVEVEDFEGAAAVQVEDRQQYGHNDIQAQADGKRARPARSEGLRPCC